jgi:hypothetical protein
VALLFSTLSRPALGPTQPPIKLVLGNISVSVTGQSVKQTTDLHTLPVKN